MSELVYTIVRRDVVAEIHADPNGEPALRVAFIVAADYIGQHGMIPDAMNLEWEDETNKYSVAVEAKNPEAPTAAELRRREKSRR